jgi:hypothetical protein
MGISIKGRNIWLYTRKLMRIEGLQPTIDCVTYSAQSIKYCEKLVEVTSHAHHVTRGVRVIKA